MELLIRLAQERLAFVFSIWLKWNVFDASLVAMALWERMLAMLMNAGVDFGAGGGNLTFFRMLPLLKMARVIRVVRALRFTPSCASTWTRSSTALLHSAAGQRHPLGGRRIFYEPGAVRTLGEAGADKDTAQQDGITLLEVVRMLCVAGADKDKAKQNGGAS